MNKYHGPKYLLLFVDNSGGMSPLEWFYSIEYAERARDFRIAEYRSSYKHYKIMEIELKELKFQV